jgi:hypothetical protein
MKIISSFFSWWIKKFRGLSNPGKAIFIFIHLLIISIVISFPVVLSIPDPLTDEASTAKNEVSARIEPLKTRLAKLDLELYTELESTDTSSLELYIQVSNTRAELAAESGRLEALKASFAGKVIGHSMGCATCPVTYTKEYQAYLDQRSSYNERVRLLGEQRKKIAQERGSLVHTTTIDRLWSERLTLTSQLETEQSQLDAVSKAWQRAGRTPLGTVQRIYRLILLGLGILVGLGIFVAFMGG